MGHNVGYINPWGEKGETRIIVNGHTGLPSLFEKPYYYPWNNVKDEEDLTFLEKHDFVIVPFYGGFLDWIIRAKETTKAKIFAITDIELNALPYAKHEALTKIVKVAKMVDWLASSNPDFTPLLKAVRKDVVEVGGWCLFNEIHKKYILAPKEKNRNLIAIGCSNSGYNRDILNNLCVFKELKKLYSKLRGYLYYVHPKNIKSIKELIEEIEVEDVCLMPEYSWEQFLQVYSQNYLAIHMYSFRVVSRLAQDSAALGIPMVGGDVNYANRLCFPDISVDPFAVDKAVEFVDKLLKDDDFYNEVRDKALKEVEYYNRENIKSRIIKVVENEEATQEIQE